MHYELKQDDPRLGRYAEDGSIELWPGIMLNGQPLPSHNVTTLRLSGNRFVVIPPGVSMTEDVIEMEGVKTFPPKLVERGRSQE